LPLPLPVELEAGAVDGVPDELLASPDEARGVLAGAADCPPFRRV
jgi:hypothetical protein